MTQSLAIITVCIGIGLALELISQSLGSDFLSRFLAEDLITLLIALMAINTTTISVIMTKIKEIYDKKGGCFLGTIKEMKKSIIEQVALIIIATILLIIRESKFVNTLNDSPIFFVDGLLLALLVYAVYILYDTACGIFVILNFENGNN